MASRASIGVAIVGVGYWGINHVRVFAAQPRARVTWICDQAQENRARAQAIAPGARQTARIDDVLASAEVDAVVLATPAPTHAELAARCLAAGKHVLVEKPLALSSQEADQVRAAAAAAKDRVLAVGHLMLFHPAVQALRSLLHSGDLGDLYYLHSTRVNLGRLRSDENALWSFGPHDLSMIDYLLGEAPVSVSTRGASYLQEGVEDVVFLNLRFSGGQMANVHLSWLDPRKERRLTLVCSRKMAEFDDVSAEKLRIYDKGYERPPAFTEYGEYLTIRQGDIHIPHLPMSEPLAAEAAHFLDCIITGAPPRADLDSALRIARVLEAAQQSLEADGRPVALC